MKRTNFILICVLIALVILRPVGTVLSACFGYTFTLLSVPAFAITTAALSVCVVVLVVIHKEKIENRTICILLSLITPLSLSNTFFYVLQHGQALALVSGWICVCFCFYLTIEYAKPLALKIVALILSVLMFFPIGLFSVVAELFPIGQNTVVQTVESPSGRYYAQVVDSDQGALGGDTLVNVYEKSEINLILFKMEKKPQQVYFGEWGEFKNMNIYWKDDSCVVINSVEYNIE